MQICCTSSEPLTCSREAEVVFLLDASMNDGSFNSVKQIVSSILSKVDVSQSATRVSIVQFSTSSTLLIKLNELNNHQQLANRLAQLSAASDGKRQLEVAIELALQELQDEGRAGVIQIMYIILMNSVQNIEATIEAAMSARKSNVLLTVIGNSASRDDLTLLTMPNNSFFVDEGNLNLQLKTIGASAVHAICNAG